LANGIQGVEHLMVNLATMLMVGMEGRAHEMTVGHIDADLEDTP
jgi:hypothetical protein